MPSENKPVNWDDDRIHRLFASSDEITRAVLSEVALEKNAPGVGRRTISRALDLQRYLPKILRALEERSRVDYGLDSPIQRSTAGVGMLSMSEDVAEMIRRAEATVDRHEQSHSGQARTGWGSAVSTRGALGEPGGGTVRVYEAGGRTALPLGTYLKMLWARRKLIVVLARAQIKAQSANASLGQLWRVLEPLMLAGVYVLLVGIIGGRISEPGRIQLIVSGMILFMFTRTSVQRGARSLVGAGNILLNTSFPRALLPATTVVEGFLRLLPALLIYAAIHIGTGRPIGVGLIAFPGLLALQAMFNLGTAMLIATITVYLRDMETMLGYLLRMWLYMTPVLYPISDLRGNLDAVAAFLRWNPLFYLFDAYHQVFEGDWPAAWNVLVTSAWAVGVLVGGFFFFVSRERAVATRI